jgi:hydroxymethylbilane synthase
LVRSLRIATRSSPLATWQAEHVAARLRAAVPGHQVELVFVDTLGDRTQALGTPLHEIGGQGVFVKEVQAAVLDGRADLAAHSAKDLPGLLTPGLHIGAVPRRDDVRDGMVGSTIALLPHGGVVATGSIRRRAQLAALRPDLAFVELRGNMATRAGRVDAGDVHAVVVGCAGLDRLGLGDRIVERLDPTIMLPQVGQAAIAVECREDDTYALEALSRVTDAEFELQVLGERAFLTRLGAGCQLPIGALTDTQRADGLRSIVGLIAAVNGSTVLRHRVVQSSADESIPALGTRLADELLAMGGDRLLADLR